MRNPCGMFQAHAVCYTSNLFSFSLTDGLYAFRAFLVSEFSEENIAFYLACKDYRNTKSEAKLQAKAQRIYNEFIGSEAPREVMSALVILLYSMTKMSLKFQFT